MGNIILVIMRLIYKKVKMESLVILGLSKYFLSIYKNIRITYLYLFKFISSINTNSHFIFIFIEVYFTYI